MAEFDFWGSRAALPPSVRKAYGFPEGAQFRFPEAEPQEKSNKNVTGKAEPFRTECGKAAFVYDIVSSRAPAPCALLWLIASVGPDL